MTPQENKPTRKTTAPKRRKRGSGSVERVGKKFRAKKQKTGLPPLYGSLRDSWDEAYADLAGLTFDPRPAKPAVPSLQDFMRMLLEGERKLGNPYGTWKRDEIVWRTRVWGSDLGKKPLDEISEVDCQKFIDRQTHALRFLPEKDEKGKVIHDVVDGRKVARGGIVVTDKRLARTGVKRIGTAVSAVFTAAKSKSYGYVKANPMREIEYPRERKEARPRRSLTPEQAASFPALVRLRTALRSQGDRLEAMILVARDTGMRRGELCALKWDSLIKGLDGEYYLVVDHGLVRTEGGIGEDSTKTDKLREVPITEETAAALLSQPRRSAYCFTTDTGKPVRPDNFSRDFRKVREAAKLPHLKLHNLRHTYVSLMLRAGVDLKAIQKLVGHASPRMIMEVYGETFDESMRDATRKMRDLLRSAV